MYISMPKDFFVPVMYDYKENLSLIDEECQSMYRENKENVNEQYQKTLEEKKSTYVNQCSKSTIGKKKVNEKYYEVLEDKEATYEKPKMCKSIDNEYIDSDTVNSDKYKNKSCNKGETKENNRISMSRRMYNDLDDEYARGFKR